jgi:replicative superfamily II helicase
MLRVPYRDDKETRAAYREIQTRVKTSVSAHLQAAACNFHVIGLVAIETIDAEARALYEFMDELTAPATGGSPVSPERAEAILKDLEEMRQRMLRFFWESLDVTHLESSFRELREPTLRKGTVAPSILGLNLDKPGDPPRHWPEDQEMVE